MSQPFVGEIRMFGFNFQPVDWAYCDGRLLPIAEYETLFILIGTTYGGDGQTTFALPDYRGRVGIHQGQGPGLSQKVIGQAGGSETVTLTTPNLPSHTHVALGSKSGGNSAVPTNAVWAPDPGANSAPYVTANPAIPPNSIGLNAAAIGATGGGQPHTNVQPYGVLNFCISLFGIFPSQN
jgi:microcystin-dependent protein